MFQAEDGIRYLVRSRGLGDVYKRQIMDGLVDEYFPLIDELADRVETLEQKIFERFDREALNDIFTMKKDLLALRRVVAPERDVFNVLMRRDPPILPVGSLIYFQDVYDLSLIHI